MGWCITPIAVDLREVKALVGCGDEELLAALLETFGDEFEMFADFGFYEEEGDSELTPRKALSQILRGEEYDEQFAFNYGHALEFLCLYCGEFLSNRHWSAMPSRSWIDEVDRWLLAAGVPPETFCFFDHLICRGAPVAIPDTVDSMSMGYLAREQIGGVRRAFETANMSVVTDRSARESIDELHGWLKTCSEAGVDLMCFCA